MTDNLDIVQLAEHAYAVTVRADGAETYHRVTVPRDLLIDLDAPRAPEPDLVRESFMFLLEREDAVQILPDFSLGEIGHHFPDYPDVLRERLAAARPTG